MSSFPESALLAAGFLRKRCAEQLDYVCPGCGTNFHGSTVADFTVGQSCPVCTEVVFHPLIKCARCNESIVTQPVEGDRECLSVQAYRADCGRLAFAPDEAIWATKRTANGRIVVVAESELRRRLSSGDLDASVLVRSASQDSFVKADACPEFREIARPRPAPKPEDSLWEFKTNSRARAQTAKQSDLVQLFVNGSLDAETLVRKKGTVSFIKAGQDPVFKALARHQRRHPQVASVRPAPASSAPARPTAARATALPRPTPPAILRPAPAVSAPPPSIAPAPTASFGWRPGVVGVLAFIVTVVVGICLSRWEFFGSVDGNIAATFLSANLISFTLYSLTHGARGNTHLFKKAAILGGLMWLVFGIIPVSKVLDQGTASVVIRLLRLDWLIQLFSNDPQKGLLWFSVLVVPYIAGNMGSGLAALGSKKPRLTLRLLVPIYVGLIGLLIVASQLANPLATPKNLKANSLERVGAVMRRTGFDEVKISQLLTRGGTVVAWGGNQSGQCNVPPGLTNVVALAAGVSHSVALTVNGTVVAWGGNEFGQATAPFKLSSVVAIGAGEFHTVALKADGSVVAWGAGMSNQPKIKPGVPRGWVNYGQSTVPRRLGNAIGVAAGGFHAMAIKADGSVRAWGAGASLDGKKYWWDYNQSVIPVDLKRVVAIAAGEIHSLALTDDGHVVAWGGNTDAAEWWDGGHNLNQIQVPEEVRDIVAIAAGDYHSLALKNDGGVVGWGAGSSSLDHRYNKGQARIPTDLRSVVAIAANGLHSVALKRNGQVIAWGYNEDGQCNVPVGLSNVGAIAAGYGHTLAIKLDDDVALAAPVQLSQTLSAPAQPMIVSGQKPSESPMNVRISQGRVQIRTASGAAVDIDDQSTSHSPLDGEALQSEIQPTQFEDFVIRAAVAEVKTNTVNSRSSKSKADTSTLSWSGILPAN